jgi:hypothetical protein
MPSDPEMNPADAFGVMDFVVNNTEKVTNEIGNAGAFDRTDIHDPQQQLDYKRAKIEGEHQGLRGVVSAAYSALGWQPSYQQEMDESTNAQRYAAAGDTKYAEDASKQQENARLQQLRAQLENAAASETKTDFQRQRESIDQNYAEQLQAANQIENGRTFQSQGFKSQADANAYAQHLREVAGAIHDAEGDKLSLARAGQMESGQGRLDVLNQAAAGDETGAARTALENELGSEQLAIDPNDKERVKQFSAVREKSLANFDADAARQSNLQAVQSNDRIAAMREEAKDAELQGEGKTDEAKIAALKFQTEQRVRSLQEQADAEGDSTKKAQLQQEAAAAAEAGKTERDALQMELQRHNTQAPALAGASGGNAISGAVANNLAEVSKKLDDAATKLEKAISNLKTLTVLKD